MRSAAPAGRKQELTIRTKISFPKAAQRLAKEDGVCVGSCGLRVKQLLYCVADCSDGPVVLARAEIDDLGFYLLKSGLVERLA